MGTLTHPPALKETGEYIKDVINVARAKNPAEPEFLQAVQEVLESPRSRHPEAPRIPKSPDPGKND